MPEQARILRGVVVLLVLLVVATAAAQNEVLRKVSELFQQQEYLAAQAELSKVDRDQLDQADQEEYDRLSEQVAAGVAGFERADRELVKAGVAFDEGRWDAADALYQAVLENEFARAEQKSRAAEQRKRIDERRKLAEAAAPGIVEVRPAEPPAQPEVVSPPAEPVAEPVQAAPSGTPATALPTGTEVQPVPTGTAAQPLPAGTPVEPLPAGTPVPVVEPIPMGIPAGPLAPRRATPLEELRARDELLWQRAVALSQELAAQARDAAARNDFNEARRLVEAAAERIEAARNYAEPVAKYIAQRQSLEHLRAEIARAEQFYPTCRRNVSVRRSQSGSYSVRAQIEALRCEKVQQLFNTACQLRRQQRFNEAAEVLRQVLQIDPTNAQARYQLQIVDDYASLMVQKEWQQTLDIQLRDSLVKAQEALIPWDVEVLYPRNWLELSARRSQTGVGIGSPEERELQRRLDEILPQFQFEDAPLGAVLKHIQEGRELNMAVDWTDLSSNGVAADRPISLGLRELPVRTVLKEVLAQAGGDIPLSYAVSDGVLRVATKSKLDREKSVVVYDVRDLLASTMRQNNATRLDPTAAVMADKSSGRSLHDARLFESSESVAYEPPAAPPEGSADATINQIMSIIRQTVAPDSWHESGSGGDASIRELNGQLIVYQTSGAQAQVRGLLEQLRAQRAMQIAIEARFLDVVQNFLDEFGVDLDFVFNSGGAGYDRVFTPTGAFFDPFTGAPVLMPRQFSRIGTTAVTPTIGDPIPQTSVIQPYGRAAFVPPAGNHGGASDQMTPIVVQQNSLSLTDPANLSTQVPGSFARPNFQPAMRVFGSFLDNLQVDFLIRATQANNRSSIVQAPRIVMNNASSTSIQIGRQPVRATINPTGRRGGVGQPVVNAAQSGSGVGLFAVISHDRRYVQVTVNQLGQFDAPTFTTFETTRASGNSPAVSTHCRPGLCPGHTQVSIPDGGTVLLGGLKQVGEVEIEAGVPILSKVPVMNRFFTNRSTVKDTRTLLILMKAKIIIQDEAEEEAFPAFSAACPD